MLSSAWDGVSELFEKGKNWVQGEGFNSNKEIAVDAALAAFHEMGVKEALQSALHTFGTQQAQEVLKSFYNDSKEVTEAKIWALKEAGYDTTKLEAAIAKRRQAAVIAQNGEQKATIVPVHETGIGKIFKSLLNLFGSKNNENILNDVTYHSQRDNVTKDGVVNGANMCNLTSLAMVMEQMGIDVGNGEKQYEDRLYEIAKELGLGGENLWDDTGEVYEEIFKYINKQNKMDYIIKVTNESTEERKFEDIAKELIKQNKPIIASGYFPNGHIVTIVGYDSNGWIVHDPYGDANTKYKNTNGNYVKYKYGRYDIGKKWFAYIK